MSGRRGMRDGGGLNEQIKVRDSGGRAPSRGTGSALRSTGPQSSIRRFPPDRFCQAAPSPETPLLLAPSELSVVTAHGRALCCAGELPRYPRTLGDVRGRSMHSLRVSATMNRYRTPGSRLARHCKTTQLRVVGASRIVHGSACTRGQTPASKGAEHRNGVSLREV